MTTRPVAIVTGGARGIDHATVRRLLDDGYCVASLDINSTENASAMAALGPSALAIEADVGNEDAVAAGVTRVRDELGAPSVLVNNAGITVDNLLFKTSVADWDDVMGAHLRGTFLMCRAVQQDMREAGGGRIINLSSVSAFGNRGQANYSAAKAGIIGLTKTLSIELGRYGIAVNAVAPGFVDTAMTRATAERIGVDFDSMAERASQQIPLGRIGAPEDIANVVAFLAGVDAAYVSGQVICVAGGPVGQV